MPLDLEAIGCTYHEAVGEAAEFSPKAEKLRFVKTLAVFVWFLFDTGPVFDSWLDSEAAHLINSHSSHLHTDVG